MAIELWAVRLERGLTVGERESMLCLLPVQRRERLMNLRNEDAYREPLCAYTMLCMALWEKYKWSELPEIALTSRGKPYFPEHTSVHFNISHTKGAVLVGVSDQDIGVDIEKIRPVSQRMMQRFAKDTPEMFFEEWVRREARSKRTGKGIGSMLRMEVPVEKGEFYYKLDTFSGYAAGVATYEPYLSEKLHKYSLDDLVQYAMRLR